ncbi:MAG: alpha/beta hydrolase family protein, partial [Planctomycetota bacterium]
MSSNPRAPRTLTRRSLIQLTTAAAAAGLVPLTARESSALAMFSGFSRPVELPKDARLGQLKDLDGYFPFVPPSTKEEWEKRKEYVRRQILVACGLWPMPERPPVVSTVHGRVEREDYTIDRVIFESSPGFLVTGSLYLPKNPSGRLPTILCPHGHWPNGRFHDHGEAQVKKEIEAGAEQFEVGGRHPLQARCVQLARMGCMVFIYDMLGYADGGSLTQELAHGFKKQRPELSSAERWGLFSAQSELRLQNAMGMQTWNSIRVLDWLTSREDCDTSRIGVTGASGGGTQTFILAAIDERVTAAFPAVMVSTAMQGGCTCENASYLRVNTGNIEFAALVAPRPISMTGADDWTVEIETKGLPELKQHFAMLGVADNVNAKYFRFPHNYNHPSRMMMYEFFNRTLKLGIEKIEERDYKPLTREESTVFDAQHPAPAKSEDAEVAILHSMDTASRMQIDALTPRDAASLADYRRVIGGALEVMIGRSMPVAGEVAWEKTNELTRDGFLEFHGRLKVAKYGEELPATYLLPMQWNRRAVLWIDGEGKSRLFESEGKPIP